MVQRVEAIAFWLIWWWNVVLRTKTAVHSSRESYTATNFGEPTGYQGYIAEANLLHSYLGLPRTVSKPDRALDLLERETGRTSIRNSLSIRRSCSDMAETTLLTDIFWH